MLPLLEQHPITFAVAVGIALVLGLAFLSRNRFASVEVEKKRGALRVTVKFAANPQVGLRDDEASSDGSA